MPLCFMSVPFYSLAFFMLCLYILFFIRSITTFYRLCLHSLLSILSLHLSFVLASFSSTMSMTHPTDMTTPLTSQANNPYDTTRTQTAFPVDPIRICQDMEAKLVSRIIDARFRLIQAEEYIAKVNSWNPEYPGLKRDLWYKQTEVDNLRASLQTCRAVRRTMQ